MNYAHPLLDEIAGGALDDHLPQLDALIKWRRKVSTQRKGIHKNATVIINAPQDMRLHKRHARVDKINPKTITVTLLDFDGNVTHEKWRLSPSLIEGAA